MLNVAGILCLSPVTKNVKTSSIDVKTNSIASFFLMSTIFRLFSKNGNNYISSEETYLNCIQPQFPNRDVSA